MKTKKAIALSVYALASIILLLPPPSYSRQEIVASSVAGIVLGRDGKTPVENATIWIDKLVMNGNETTGRRTTKTDSGGKYEVTDPYLSLSLRGTRIRVTVVIGNQIAMIRGDARSDEIYETPGKVTTVNFDLSKISAQQR